MAEKADGREGGDDREDKGGDQEASGFLHTSCDGEAARDDEVDKRSDADKTVENEKVDPAIPIVRVFDEVTEE